MKHICVTDRHDMTLAVKVALNFNTTNNNNQLFLDLLPLVNFNFFFQEHYFQNIEGRIFRLHIQIDHIKEKGSVQEP